MRRAGGNAIARRMHDIRLIRENPEAFDAGLARRGLAPLSARIVAADASLRVHNQARVGASMPADRNPNASSTRAVPSHVAPPCSAARAAGTMPWP